MKKYGIYLNTVQKDQKVGFCYSIGNELSLMHTPVKVLMTMFESSKPPEFWEKWVRMADEVIVPCTFCQKLFKDTWGIDSTVVPLGIEPDNIGWVDRTRTDEHKFTFFHMDAFKYRKGWDLVFHAFNSEFGEKDGDDVRLIFKTTLDITPPLHEYPKISVIKGRIPHEELKELYQSADCFVFPTRGEGFGLTPLEALATGMPAIVPNHTGISEYFDNRFCYDLETREVRAKYDNYELRGMELGVQWEPLKESVQKQMRTAYNEWKAGTGKYAVGRSQEMADYAKGFNIEDTVQKIVAILKKYV
jgi:glycosyltransferase involved in cell wall biosynthesis